MARRATTTTSTLTERQQKWFRSVEEGLVRDTGRTLEAWVEIARGAPAGGRRAQEKWLKETHGLGVNRAATILSRAFPDGPDWDDPEALLDLLWKDAGGRAIYDKVAAIVTTFDGAIVGPRKTFVGFSRTVQFAAIQPAKGGARLGLALDPSASARLEPRKKSESWADRLKAVVVLADARDVDAEVKRLLKAAYAGV